ncbi:hypothetical protein NPIL_672031 [Nephila pilipes]|uniref:Uncharacterized protein n=1 Tax=Nephila pilipes TaxID=299642 RepID=A0A8X6NSS1_NEPPI|nr:hypothetical protein NPIL_672031 [Nephila pilipes]
MRALAPRGLICERRVLRGILPLPPSNFKDMGSLCFVGNQWTVMSDEMILFSTYFVMHHQWFSSWWTEIMNLDQYPDSNFLFMDKSQIAAYFTSRLVVEFQGKF